MNPGDSVTARNLTRAHHVERVEDYTVHTTCLCEIPLREAKHNEGRLKPCENCAARLEARES